MFHVKHPVDKRTAAQRLSLTGRCLRRAARPARGAGSRRGPIATPRPAGHNAVRPAAEADKAPMAGLVRSAAPAAFRNIGGKPEDGSMP